MPTSAKDAQPGKMYKLSKRSTTNLGSNTWYTLAKTTAAKYIDRLHVRRNGCTGRHMFQMGRFKNNPDLILFVRHTRGTDTFSGKYDITQKVLLEPDCPLREIKHKPGYARPRVETVEPDWEGLQRAASSEKQPAPAPAPAKREETTQQASAFSALKARPIESEDVMQDTVNEIIKDKK